MEERTGKATEKERKKTRQDMERRGEGRKQVERRGKERKINARHEERLGKRRGNNDRGQTK